MPGLLTQRLPRAFGFLAAICLMIMVGVAAAFAETPVLTAPEAAQKVTSGDIILLDIRTHEEWAETGLAEGAWPVSMHTPEFARQLQALLTRFGPDRIGLICATGGRTAYVTSILEKNGITGVVDVSEGMFGNGTNEGWIARGLPVVSLEAAQSRFKAAQESWE